MSIKAGDVVQLNSGGYAMTVEKFAKTMVRQHVCGLLMEK